MPGKRNLLKRSNPPVLTVLENVRDQELEQRIETARLALLTAPERDKRARMLDLESLLRKRSGAQIERMERDRGLA